MDDITGAAGQFAATLVTDALNDTKAVAPAGTTLATTQAADLQTRNVALVAAATTQALANTGALQTLVTTLAGAARTLNNAYADAAQAAADALAGAADALDDSWAANTLAMTQGGAGALTSLSGAIASGLSGWTPAAGTASPTGTSTVRVAGVSVAPPGGSGGSVLNAMPAASSAPAASNFSFTATYPDPGPSFGDVAGTVFDAALGFSNGVFTALNPFGFGLPIGPAFGHQEVFDGGNMVGWVTGWVGTLVGPGLVLKAAKGTVYACRVGQLVYGYGAVTNAVGAVRAAWTMYQNGQFDFFSVAQLGLSTIGFSSNLSKFFAQACFAAGTPIVTPEGSTPIEQLRVGDWVLSRPEDDPEAPAVPRRVVNVFHNYVPLLNLRVGGRTIRTTAEHPFWVRQRGWTDAHQLRAGDELGDDGRWLILEGVEGEQESAPVYNVEVEEYHTYFVGNGLWGFSVWAHNASYIVPPSANPPPARFAVNSKGVATDRGLANAGKALDPSDTSGLLTKAGRALEKHGSRPGSAFPRATGNAAAKNAQGQAALKSILDDAAMTAKSNRFGGLDYIASGGRGARYDGNGVFMGFLEP